MKNILILAYEYAPYNRQGSTIGAQRPAGFAKFLPELGWNPVVLCSDYRERRLWKKINSAEIDKRIAKALSRTTEFEPTIIPIPSLAYDDWIDKLWLMLIDTDPVKGTYQTGSLLKSIIRKPITLLKLFRGDHSQSWQKTTLYASSVIIKKIRIDFILAEHGPDAGFMIAKKMSQKFNIPFSIDFRDPILHPIPSIIRKLIILFYRHVTRSVSFIINVNSHWSNIDKAIFQAPCFVITNGFDNYKSYVPPDNKYLLNFAFLGSFYPAFQNPVLLFETLRLLRESGITPDTFKIHYYGSNYNDFVSYSQDENDIKFIINHGFISKNLLDSELKSMDGFIIFPAITQSDFFFKFGFHPGKIFDYMSWEKPVLCFGDDGGLLSELMKETNIGYLLKNLQECVEVILELVRIKLERGSIPFKGNREVIDSYSRRNQTKKLVSILNEFS